MTFTNFEAFKPYMTTKELEQLNQLYNTIQSSDIPLQQKLTCYRSFNTMVSIIRNRIHQKQETKREFQSNKIIPIWYNKGK